MTLAAAPTSFASLRSGAERRVPIVLRPDSHGDEASKIVAAIASVDWAAAEDAYGAARDVGDQLAAVAVGDEATRAAAWWNLWGNIHHQGTVYTATAPAVPILGALAEWRDFPDRAETIAFLTEVARATQTGPMPGTHAGVYAATDEAAETLALALRASVERATTSLMGHWDSEEPAIRRVPTLLVAVQPQCRSRYESLVESEVPEHHRQAWLDYQGWPESEEAARRREELEHWAYSSS